MDPDDARLYLNIEWLDFGSLELTKKNTNQDLVDGAKFNIKSVSYDGYNENTVVKNGKIKVNDLLVGTYEVKEMEAPHGYLLNTDTFTVKVEKDKTTVLSVTDDEPKGNIDIQKEIDTSKTNGLKGDATAEGVTLNYTQVKRLQIRLEQKLTMKKVHWYQARKQMPMERLLGVNCH